MLSRLFSWILRQNKTGLSSVDAAPRQDYLKGNSAMPTPNPDEIEWYKVAELDSLPEGRVMSVTAGTKTLALVHFRGQYTAMDNRCPHQGGPLGEGAIETGIEDQCWLRCPWHGWDFDPLTGKPPGGHEDSGQEMFAVDVRDDGIYVAVPAEPPHDRTVTDVMAETMVNWGVRTTFGMVGHSNLGFADALRLQEVAGNLHYYGIRHEGAAAFACSGYAKASGRPASCLTIAGPGATNLMTGLWDAKVDRAPVLALTGQVQVQVFGPGAFQDIDLAAAFAPVAEFSQTVLPTSHHAELMTLACKNAIVNRDVAHLIFPDDVQTVLAGDAPASGPDGRIGPVEIGPPLESLDAALAEIGKSTRPIIVVGYGAKESMAKIVELAEALKAPVLTTFKAKGQIPDTHPHAAGVLGRSGTPIASWFMNECDLILAFGTSFSNHTGIEPSKRIVQVDFDRMHLGKFHAVDVPVWGEVGVTAKMIGDSLPKSLKTDNQVPEIAKRWAIWRDEKANRVVDDHGQGVNSSSIFAALTKLVPDDAIIAVDVGNNTYSFGRYFECSGQSVLMSGYLGSIGFGFPAAMGAWAATQDFDDLRGRKIISVSGDGGFGQYAMEFTTAVKYGMDITHILLNNSQLGKITKEQRAGEWPVWQTSLHNLSFSAFARACGGHGERVTDPDGLEQAIQKALDYKGPALVEVVTDAELI